MDGFATGFMFFDWTYVLVLIGIGICIWAQSRVKGTFTKYSKVRATSGLTGVETATKILAANGIYDVTVAHIQGNLNDHYDPRTKTINLSDSTYASTSVAAVGVAAHEVGHAIQHNQSYVPLTLRSGLVPVARFGSAVAWPLILLGFFINHESAFLLIQLGIIMFSTALLFQIVTLPVEFNASRHAMAALESNNILRGDEVRMSRKVLSAAALTYVANTAAMALQLLRIILIARRR
jgi:Zn-dependent membrane protease YugP